jgi:hypothetical protein
MLFFRRFGLLFFCCRTVSEITEPVIVETAALLLLFLLRLLFVKRELVEKTKLREKVLSMGVVSFLGIGVEIYFDFLSFLERKIDLFSEFLHQCVRV